jgi:hypothetical protein
MSCVRVRLRTLQKNRALENRDDRRRNGHARQPGRNDFENLTSGSGIHIYICGSL